MSCIYRSLVGKIVRHNFDNTTFRVLEELPNNKIRVMEESELGINHNRIYSNRERILSIYEVKQ
jgi:hypothetical protein